MIDFTAESKKEEIRRILAKKGARVYFTGIGGISMSSLAVLLQKRGAKVIGSDLRKSEITEMLTRRGILVRYSHAKEYIMSFRPDLAVFSLAVNKENPEYKAVLDMSIPAVSRAELLGALLLDHRVKTGVSGSHGKSTVTAMIGKILSSAGKNPTILCGAEISDTAGLVFGGRDHIVFESCEYGDSFLKLPADVQVLLNLELDHTDYFKTESALCDSFVQSANNAGCCVLNYDSEKLRSLVDRISSEKHTFSRGDGAEYRYVSREFSRASYSFKLYRWGREIGEYHPRIRGEFNLVNAVSAAVTADVLGVSFDASSRAVAEFSGIKRRLELICTCGGKDVFYDYAHHPSEIAAVRDTLYKMGYKKISVIFAPHTYSRTASFFDSFAKELAKFNTVYVTEVYGARETAVVGINSSSLAQAVRDRGTLASAVSFCEYSRLACDILSKENDCVVLMGAGDLEEIKKEFLKI